MGIKLYYQMTVTKQDGSVKYDSGLKPSHSYVLQFLRLLYGFYGGTWILSNVTATAKDVDGNTSNITELGKHCHDMGRVDAPQGDSTYGIVVGLNTGTTAEDNANYVLDTQVAHGVGAGQLNHQAVTFVAPVVDGANVDFDISRPLVNESGGPITIDEIGLYCKCTLAATKYFCLIRDVTAPTVVADTETLTVVYTLRTTA